MISGRPSNLGTVGFHMLQSQSLSPTEPQGAVVLFPPSRQSRRSTISPAAGAQAPPRPPPIANARGWPDHHVCPSGGEAQNGASKRARNQTRRQSAPFFHEVDGEVAKDVSARKGAGLRRCKEA